MGGTSFTDVRCTGGAAEQAEGQWEEQLEPRYLYLAAKVTESEISADYSRYVDQSSVCQ